MFKIVENGDGSTSVFCNESGRLICNVKGKKPSAVAIGRPLIRHQQPKKHKSVAIGDLTISYNGLPKEDSPLEKRQRIKTWTDSINSDDNSFVSASEVSSCEELSDECVDQFSFLQAFDLIATSELNSKKPEDLRRTFPLRSISRTKPVLPFHHQVARPHEEVELCSPLGTTLSRARQQMSDAAREQACKKYDKYCKFSVLSLHPNLTLHPALRNREILKYPVTFRPQKGRNSPVSHLYTFSTQQRLERYRSLATGLNKRGRHLKRRCKKLCVRLGKLTEEEIAHRTGRRDPDGPPASEGQSSGFFSEDLIRETLDRFRRKSEENAIGDCRESDDDVIVIGEVINNRTAVLALNREHCYVKSEPWTIANGASYRERPNDAGMQRCMVPLEDIKNRLVSTGGEYYLLRGTLIRVFAKHLATNRTSNNRQIENPSRNVDLRPVVDSCGASRTSLFLYRMLDSVAQKLNSVRRSFVGITACNSSPGE